jgi:subtilase family serine protease
VIRYAAVFVLNGCTSATAVIAQETNTVRGRAGSAKRHLDAAQADLDAIEIAAAEVHQQVAFVSDDQHPVYQTLQYLSIAVIAAAIFGAIYYIRGRK